jgi:DNA polymerase III epsilon subunit-like protein
VLDTETTGLRRSGPGHAEIHQLAAVLLDEDGEEVAVWEGRACPRRLSGWEVARALEVSGTRAADLRGHPPPAAMLARFWEWYVGHGSPVATAYNRPFDGAILRCEEVVLDWGPCLQQRAQQALSQKRLKLERAAELLQIPLPGGQTHQALDDARLAAAVLVALARRRTGRAAA